MSNSFIDETLDQATLKKWCLKYGCTTCGAFEFRSEIERSAISAILKENSLDNEASQLLVEYIKNVDSKKLPSIILNKAQNQLLEIFPHLRARIIAELNNTKSNNKEALKIILCDFDILEYSAQFIGSLIEEIINEINTEETNHNNKLQQRPIKIILIDVLKKKIKSATLSGPIYCDLSQVEEAIGESDREVDREQFDINGKVVDVIYGLGSRGESNSYWKFKSASWLLYGNAAIICEDDKSMEYGPYYGRDCPLSINEVVHEVEWGEIDPKTMEQHSQRSANLSDVEL